MAYDCFLSYSSHDLAHAEAVYARLAGAGFNVWFDKARLDPGCDWHHEIEAGCENSRVVLPLLTPRWKQSEWTRYETYGAEAVIPLLVEGNWSDVSTPPLTPYQNFTVAIPASGDADWQRLFNSIRECCARKTPQKAERVQHLRYRPARYFVGREKELDEIHEKLFVNPTAALTQGHVEAIAAMGGVGKTTLARQYAEKFWRCYPQMFWADCRQGLETEFAAIHDLLRQEPVYAALSNQDKAGWVRYEFNQSANRPRRLLILDNAEDEESVLEWIPKTGNCHTLITSRFSGWSPGIETYRVWVLDPEPARELLLRRSARTDTNEERAACDAVTRKLEYLPLALEQAAAYVGAQPPGWGFAQYLRRYEENERALLAEKTSGATEYPDSVYLTWRATIDKLPQGARAILRLHAFLATTATPVAMFVRGVDRIVEEGKLIAGETGKSVDGDIEGAGEFAVRKWVSSLAKYSMAQLQVNDSFSVHGLVHAVEWHALGEKRAGVLARTTDLFLAYAEQPSWEPESRRMWDVLLPHAVRLNEAAKRLQVPPNIDLLDRIYSAYSNRGQYGQAIPILRECWSLRKSHMGESHAEVLETQDTLAFYLRANGEYEEAERLQKDVVASRQRLLGDNHIDTIGSFHNLAFINERMGRYDECEALLRKALAGYEKELGSEHRNTLTCTQDLGVLLAQKGDYLGATALVKGALEGFERTLGPDHPDTLRSVGNLAVLLQSQGEYAAAEPLCRRALEAREHVLGPEHPDTLASVNNLAELLVRTGDYAAAEPLLRRALGVTERVLGPEHPNTLRALSGVASLLESKGDYAAAEPLYRRAMKACERVLGPEHPETLASVNNLAELLVSTGDYAAAEPLYRRALDAYERMLGPEHPDTLVSVANLAGLLRRRGDYAAAEPLYRRALELMERLLGPEHPHTLITVGNLARLLRSRGDYAAAEPLYRRALESMKRVLGPEHPHTLTATNDLAGMLQSKGDYAAAESLYRRALESRERVLGPEHPDTLASLKNLADLLAKTGRPDESAALRKEYIARMATKEASAPPLELRQLALECYREGDYSHAEQLLRRVLEARFEVPDTHCLLVHILLLMDRDQEAQAEVEKACQNRADWQPYTGQRVYFFQVVFALLNGTSPTEALQDLRKELLRPDAMMEWDLKRLLDHLKPRLTPEGYELIEALSAAINDRAAMTHLETLPAWRTIL